MQKEFHMLEESLKNYLTEGVVDSYNKLSISSYRYNNLKVYMDSKKNSMPHFIISIGMSEAIFAIETYDKISGGLGPDERNVRRWMERAVSREDLTAAWAETGKVEEIDMTK